MWLLINHTTSSNNYYCIRGHLQTIGKNNVIVTLCFNPPLPPFQASRNFYTKCIIQHSAKQRCLPVTKRQAQPPPPLPLNVTMTLFFRNSLEMPPNQSMNTVKPCYFLQPAIWGKNSMLPLSEFYSVYESCMIIINKLLDIRFR